MKGDAEPDGRLPEPLMELIRKVDEVQTQLRMEIGIIEIYLEMMGGRIYADQHGLEGSFRVFRIHPSPIFPAMNFGGLSRTQIKLPVFFGDPMSCEAQALEAAYWQAGHLDPEEWRALIEKLEEAGDPIRAREADDKFRKLRRIQRG
jgi:hypothetical protein